MPETIIQQIKNADSDGRITIADSLSDDLITSWLSEDNWKVRNAAVKIIGELKLTTYTDTLIKFITDRTPAKFIDRLLGGDYYQVGFIRRNAAHALGCVGKPSPELTTALLIAINDKYWEVRAAAIEAFQKLYSEEPSGEIVQALLKALQDRKFEVVAQAVYALGALSPNEAVIRHFQKLYDHPNILVKTAIIGALKTLLKRGIVTDEKKVNDELNNIFIPGKYTFNLNNS